MSMHIYSNDFLLRVYTSFAVPADMDTDSSMMNMNLINVQGTIKLDFPSSPLKEDPQRT